MADTYYDRLVQMERAAWQQYLEATAGGVTDYSIEGQSESLSAAANGAFQRWKELHELLRKAEVSDVSTPLGGW